MLTGKKIVLAVTGSIAAYKSCELLRLLIKRGAEVRVIMTEAAQHFVTPLTFEALGAQTVYTGDWDQHQSAIPHIDATKDASLLLVAPATANILAKAAQGMADDILSAAILAARCPVAYAPAMNTYMWHNQATQRNVTQLTQDGALFLGPASGEQACGDVGSGRMLEPEEILEALKGKTFQKTDGEEIRVCPVCGTRMVKNYTSHLKTVQIDECYNCGGKFLDAGELTKIRNEFNTEDERIEAFNAYAKELLGDAITPSNKKDKITPFAKIMKRIADRFI